MITSSLLNKTSDGTVRSIITYNINRPDYSSCILALSDDAMSTYSPLSDLLMTIITERLVLFCDIISPIS